MTIAKALLLIAIVIIIMGFIEGAILCFIIKAAIKLATVIKNRIQKSFTKEGK